MDKIDKKLFEQIVILDSIEKIRNIKKNIKLTNNLELLQACEKFLIILQKVEENYDIDPFNISMGKIILSQNKFSLL